MCPYPGLCWNAKDDAQDLDFELGYKVEHGNLETWFWWNLLGDTCIFTTIVNIFDVYMLLFCFV